MSDHQRETAFLRHCILYEDTVERHNLDARLTLALRDERCVRCALWLMALLTALAIAGVCYATVFLTDYPHNMTRLITPFIVKVFCALGVGSLICMLAFAGLGVVYRKALDQRREECRRLAAKLFESRLGKPLITPLQVMRDNRAGEGDDGTVRVANEANGSPVKTESAARG